jgi:hypothetical protein
MKKFFMFFMVVALVLVMASAVAAAPSTYDVGFQLANQSGTDATVVITYVNQDGSTNFTANDTIPANGSKTYFPIGASAGFNGSVVVSSDQPVVAIANVLGDGLAFGASYESFSAGASEVNLPLIMKANFNFDTWFNVQNTATPGSGSSVDVTVSYAGTACTETATIAAGAAATFNQAINSCLPTPYVGAASITATGGSIVATVLQTGPAQLLAYNGFTSGTTNPVMPLVQSNNFGYFTGIQIQNTGAASTDVTVDFIPGQSGTACSETKAVAAGASATFGLTGSCLFTQTFIGGATVSANTGNEDLVAIVNQSNFTNKGAAYDGLDTANSTATLSFPLVMDRNFGYFTGFNIYAVGDAQGECVFTASAGTAGPNATFDLTAGSVLLVSQFNAHSNGFVGSATCTSTTGSIMGIANELGLNGSGDTLLTYGGFNQ